MRRRLLARAVHRLQIGRVAAPDLRRGLGFSPGAGEKGGLDQLALIADDQPVGGAHRCQGRFPPGRGDGLRIHPALTAAGIRADRRRAVPALLIAAQDIGPAGHGLGLPGLLGKALRQLCQQDAGEIGLQIHAFDASVPQDRKKKPPVMIRLDRGLCFRLRPGTCSHRCGGFRGGRGVRSFNRAARRAAAACGRQQDDEADGCGSGQKSVFHFSSCLMKTIDEKPFL